jgi:sigma-B regulation protein RsbU (phosphoserine phosphatase)
MTAPMPIATPTATARILIVDDVPANLDVLRHVLEADGHQVLLAPDGEVALRSAAKALPDLILLDVTMPGLDGYEVCRRLKAVTETQAIPVIFITANDATDDVVAGFDAGGLDYIAKPFRDSEVLSRVRSHLELYRLTQELARKNTALAAANEEIKQAHAQLDQAQRKLIESLEGELQKARDLQMGLMPKAAPDVPGLDVAGSCLPATDVGGDYYQYFQGDGAVTICVADVTGHSMEAAIPAARFDGILDSQIELGDEPAALLARLNQRLARKMPGQTHVCCLLARIDATTGALRLANAACPFPYVYRSEGDEMAELETEAYPLSVRPDAEYETVERQLRAGDVLVLFSDGIVETRNAAGETYGDERLQGAIRRGCREGEGGADVVLRRILSDVQAFGGGREQEDDQTVVVIAVEEKAS